MKLLLWLVLGGLAWAAYEGGVFDSSSTSSSSSNSGYSNYSNPPTSSQTYSGYGSSDFESTAASRPGAGSYSSGTPDIGSRNDTNAYRRQDCNNLGSLKKQMQDAYNSYLSYKDTWHYEDYIYYKKQYDSAIRQCR